MIIAVCVFGAVLLISLPVVEKILSDSNNNLVIENESSAGWNQIDGEMIYIDPKTNQRAVGLYVIEGQSYLFDSDGGITRQEGVYESIEKFEKETAKQIQGESCQKDFLCHW